MMDADFPRNTKWVLQEIHDGLKNAGWDRGASPVLVSNDLTFDQRVRKTCATLQRAGHEPVLIGRRMNRADARPLTGPIDGTVVVRSPQRPPVLPVAPVPVCRALAVAPCRGVTAVWANDLDTLGPAVRRVADMVGPMAYDSHEWFTEAEGLNGQRIKKAVWRGWERRCFRGINRMLTVNSAIAEAYGRDGLKVDVVPNVPERLEPAQPMPRQDLGWPEDKVVLLMQGAFMDRDRGALDAVRAMVHLPDAHLALIGAGPEHAEAGPLATRIGVADRVHLHERMEYAALRRCTAAADIGLSLDRPTVDNFRFSLPNKLFDFLHAGLPVVCSDLPVADVS